MTTYGSPLGVFQVMRLGLGNSDLSYFSGLVPLPFRIPHILVGLARCLIPLSHSLGELCSGTRARTWIVLLVWIVGALPVVAWLSGGAGSLPSSWHPASYSSVSDDGPPS